jgi:chromosome segregation and condensation protein ScpB
MPTLTSLTSYREAVLNGKLSGQRARIMACLFDSAVPLSRQQITQVTGIPINAVCGRVNELLGRVKDIPEEKQIKLIRVAYEEKHPISGGTREYLEPIWPQHLLRPKQTAFLPEVHS